MYEYEIQQLRSAERIRRAEHERMAREAIRLRRAARAEDRAAGARTDEAESHSRRPRRLRSPRTA